MSYFPLSRWNNACYSTANILVTCAKTPKQREKPLLPLERQNHPNSPSRNCSKSSTQLVICFWMLRSPTSTSKTKWQQTDKAAFQRSWQIFQKFSCALPRIPCRGPTGATRVTSVSGGGDRSREHDGLSASCNCRSSPTWNSHWYLLLRQLGKSFFEVPLNMCNSSAFIEVYSPPGLSTCSVTALTDTAIWFLPAATIRNSSVIWLLQLGTWTTPGPVSLRKSQPTYTHQTANPMLQMPSLHAYGAFLISRAPPAAEGTVRGNLLF